MRYTEIVEDVRSAPFVRLFLPLAAGVIFQVSVFPVKPSATLLCLALFLFAVLAHKFFTSYARRWWFGFAAYLLLFFAGVALVQNVKSESELPVGKTIFVEALVNDEPSVGASFTKLNVKTISYQDSLNEWRSLREKMVVYLRNDSTKPAPRMGDKILAKLKLSPVPAAKNPYEFDYGAYLRKQQIFTTAFANADSYLVISSGNARIWQLFPKMVSSHLLRYFSQQGLKGDELAVLQALTIGDKSLINSDLKQLYMDTGAMHILAVSGMHVGIISMILGWLLIFMEKRKHGKVVRGVLVLVFIWLYSLVAGLAPSILRATIMFSVVTVGQMFSRRTNTYNSLAFSAFLLCVLNPYCLFDAGFQLSYVAVISIVFFYPHIYRLLHFKRWLFDSAWSLVAVAIAANIGTFPVTLFLFHQFPVHFILTNVLATLPTTFAMGGFLATLIFMFIPIPYVGWAFAQATGWCIWALNFVIRLTDSLPFSRVEALWLTPLQTWLLLLCIVLFAFFIWTKRTKLFLASLVLLVACFALRALNKYEQAQQKVMAVYSVKNTSLITFVNGRSGFALCDSLEVENNFDFNTKNHLAQLGFAGLKSVEKIPLQRAENEEIVNENICQGFVAFSGKTVKILRNEPRRKPQQPLPVDYLILTSQCQLRPEQILEIYQPQHFIIDASVAAREAYRFRRVLAERSVPFHCVRSSGAFVQHF
ncbi:MAG: ComEC family competence protein [Prevotellaceae bacterium]|jgi:competence protein ComEC|nr:ComEC family competence protein [Prevotellaceae bacterium]